MRGETAQEMGMARNPLVGSERVPVPGATDVGPADPNEALEVSVLVRRGRSQEFHDLAARLGSGQAGPPRGREGFAEKFAADDADLQAVQAFAQSHGLRVSEVHPARRTVKLTGTVAQFEQAFGVTLRRFAIPNNGEYRGRVGVITLPEDLQ